MDPRPAVEVQIFGHPFTIRSEADQAYILSVAAYVDRKMREVTSKVPAATMARVAVLASLNIADELFRERRSREAGEQEGAARTAELERTLDQALGEES